MSRLIARLMLALFMLPMAAVVYIIMMAVGFEVFGSMNEMPVFFWAGVVTTGFVAIYWIVLWQGSVRWTGTRIRATIIAGAGAVVLGVFFGIIGMVIDITFGMFLGAASAIFFWLIGTVLIWRETVAERGARLRESGTAVVCITCGYNLTGLRQTTCPECGANPTLDELLAGQPSRETEELAARG